jgi:hypothetical protein
VLWKEELAKVLEVDDKGVLKTHLLRILRIKLTFCGLSRPEGGVWMPGCHHVAYAYAKAFGVEVVDGEKLYCSGHQRSFWSRNIVPQITTYTHSWNRVEIAPDVRVILDIFPDETCSMMPIVVRDPHPAYWQPSDMRSQCRVEAFMEQSKNHDYTKRLADEFLRIDAL